MRLVEATAGSRPRLKFVLAGIGTKGDVFPLLALGRELVSRGHPCDLLSNEGYAELAQQHGLSFCPVTTSQTNNLVSGRENLEQHVFPSYAPTFAYFAEQTRRATPLAIVNLDGCSASNLMCDRYALPSCRIYVQPQGIASVLRPPWPFRKKLEGRLSATYKKYGLPQIYAQRSAPPYLIARINDYRREADPTPKLQRRRRQAEGVRHYFRSLKERRAAVAFVMIAGACAQLLGIVSPALSQVLIDQVIQPVRREWLFPVLAVMIGATLASLLLQWLYQLTLAHLQTALKSKLTNQMGRRLLRLPLEFVESRSRGDLMQRVTSHAGLGPLLTQAALGLFQAFFILVLAALMLAYDVRLGALALGIDLMRLVVVRKTREDARQRSAGELAGRARENSVVLQATASAEMVKAFGLEARLEQWYERRLSERLRWTQKAARLNFGAGAWLSLFDGAARAAILWFGGMKVISFQMPLGVFAGFLAIRGLLGPPLTSVWSTVESWLEFRSVLARSDEVLSQPAETEVRRQCADGLRGQLTLKNVGFRYGSGAPWVLRGVSLVIEPGDHVALIGPSGQGKSTLLEILAGVLVPSEGEVLLDGVPVGQCEERSLARAFGTVVGAPIVTAGTIRENLILRLPDASDEEVRDAARAACFEEVVTRTPQGYETRLESEGANLSGGERQRLGLAQALLGRPRVLFLDEATCFLDAATEKRVLDNLLGTGATVVSVAHRPAVIQASHRVFLIRDGRVSNAASQRADGPDREKAIGPARYPFERDSPMAWL